MSDLLIGITIVTKGEVTRMAEEGGGQGLVLRPKGPGFEEANIHCVPFSDDLEGALDKLKRTWKWDKTPPGDTEWVKLEIQITGAQCLEWWKDDLLERTNIRCHKGWRFWGQKIETWKIHAYPMNELSILKQEVQEGAIP